MSRRGPARLATLALASALSACTLGPWTIGTPPPPPRAPEPARVRVELFGGFGPERPSITTGRVALVVDATDGMGRASAAGRPLVRAARAAAQRFATALPETTDLTLAVFGNDWGARCDTPASHYAGDREEIIERSGKLRARGRGSLAAALDDLAAPEAGGFERVVVVTGLSNPCGDDLCRAGAVLAARGIRLDLVLLGDAEAPECLAQAARAEGAESTLPWRSAGERAFHLESVGPDPAVLVCGESGGLPVQVAPGNARVVVKLEPPLRVQRNLLPGTRWVLQVLDFPGLDPPERQWRWQADAPRRVPPAEIP